MSARRWVCPKCDNGCLAPSRPRRDDARLYCFPCSAKTGRLVKRTCPAADNTKAREEAAQRAKREANRAATQATRVTEQGQRAQARDAAKAEKAALRAMPIGELVMLRGRCAFEEAAKRYMKLKAWGCDLKVESINIRLSVDSQFSSGHAWGCSGEGRLAVTAGTDIADVHATILHELAHLAAPKDADHAMPWRLIFRAAVSEVIGRPVSLDVEGSDVVRDLNKHEFHNRLKRALGLFLYGGAQ